MTNPGGTDKSSDSAVALHTVPSDFLRLSNSQARCIGSMPICPIECIPGTSLLFFTGCPFPQASWLFGFSSCLDFLDTFVSALLSFHRYHLFRNQVFQLSFSQARLQTGRYRRKLDNHLIGIHAPSKGRGDHPMNRKKILMKIFWVVFISFLLHLVLDDCVS